VQSVKKHNFKNIFGDITPLLLTWVEHSSAFIFVHKNSYELLVFGKVILTTNNI